MKQTKGLIAGLACLLATLLPTWPATAQPGPHGTAGGPIDALATQVDDANTAAIDTLQSKTTLSDLPCSHDQIARFDGTNWVCAADPTALFESLHNAICVKADQDHDSIHPLTCDVRRAWAGCKSTFILVDEDALSVFTGTGGVGGQSGAHNIGGGSGGGGFGGGGGGAGVDDGANPGGGGRLLASPARARCERRGCGVPPARGARTGPC